MSTQGFTRKDIGLLEMQKKIMDAQLEREKEGRQQHRLILCDRSAVDPIVYAVLTAENQQEALTRKETLLSSTEFQDALEIYKHSTFILLTPVDAWLIDDGTRHMDNQNECSKIFEKTLTELGIAYFRIGTEMRSLEARVALATGLVFAGL